MLRKSNYLSTIGLLWLLALLGGCATPMKMDLTSETRELDVSKKSVLLMSAELVNQYRTSYQPGAFVVYVEKPNAQSAEDRFNFLVDKEGTEESDAGNKYLFRMSVDPGQYMIRGVGGFSGIFPVRGQFLMPMHMTIDVQPGTVTYLGRVKGVVRERDETKNEFRAGGVIPLIDQAVTGFSGGTFDVAVSDASREDLARFKEKFPVLKAANIKTQLLPAFDRKVAQQWWEQN